MEFIVVQFLNGLASASSLFLVASGLSIIFGVTRIVNFAHGSLYMLGAYLAVTLAAALPSGAFGFWGAILIAALTVGLLAALVEVVLLRRIYRAPELFQLLATFGVVLVVEDLVLMIWGPEDRLGPLAPGLDGAIAVLGQAVPEYDIALIVLGPLVLLGLEALFRRTRWGTLVRAATQDRDMVAVLGVDQAWLFTGVVALGGALAGLGGALQMPREAIHHGMDLQVIAEVFVVVVVGGLGSIRGAFLASVLIAEIHAFGIVVLPESTLVLAFVVMGLVLMLRPHGLLGRAEAPAAAPIAQPRPRLIPDGPRPIAVMALALLALAAAPWILGAYPVYVLTEILIFVLFAASLHLIMGPGGLISFGHAAYFGLGAYAAALVLTKLGWSMVAAITIAPAVAGAGAALVGWFCARLSGVYLAMLTLAFAQIVFAAAFQWYGFTGGDNGILGVWPDSWAGSPNAFYYLVLVVAGGGTLLLRWITFSPFGYALRGVRDARPRAAAGGIAPGAVQWAAFAIAGAFAGLAGALFAFFKGSVFPTLLAIPTSVDALVMVLLGGVNTVSGPIVGAALYKGLQIWMSASVETWRLVLGLLILAAVLAFPEGVAGLLGRLRGRKKAIGR